MARIWFNVPVHDRDALTRVCLRQLRRTCDATEHDATAVIIGEGPILDWAHHELGFATVQRDNRALGRKFNDGYQLACDPDYNPNPADYVIPCGSDDWIDPIILRRMPPQHTIGIFSQIAVVNEDRTRLSRIKVGYQGGAGIRIIPRDWIAACGYRPAEEDRKRAIDTSTLMAMYALSRRMPPMVDLNVHGLQIVDWKSHGEQLNTYRMLAGYRRGDETDVWSTLAEFYPSEALEEMRELPAVAA